MKTIILAALLSVSSVVSANPLNDIVLGMSKTSQEDILGKTLRASGKTCSYVSKIKYTGLTDQDEALWIVQCPSESYMVKLLPDAAGSTRITECSLLKSVGINCWGKF